MSKATLEYNLPEEENEFRLAIAGSDFSYFLWEFEQEFLRRNIKYEPGIDLMSKVNADLEEGDTLLTPDQVLQVLEAVRSTYYEMKLSRNLPETE